MKRITKKRLAELRSCKSLPVQNEIEQLVDAYERKPDEVAEGWCFLSHDGKALDYSIRCAIGPTKIPHAHPVRVEVYHLTKGGKR